MQPVHWFIEETLHILREGKWKQYRKEKPKQTWCKPTLSITDLKVGHNPKNKKTKPNRVLLEYSDKKQTNRRYWKIKVTELSHVNRKFECPCRKIILGLFKFSLYLNKLTTSHVRLLQITLIGHLEHSSESNVHFSLDLMHLLCTSISVL